MTNVSKRKLDRSVQKKLLKQITNLFTSVTSRTAQPVFEGLFTESEQVMFVKRFAMVLMLERGYSRYRISKTLDLSETTVNRIYLRYEEGEFEALIKVVRRKEFNSKAFWNTVEVVLRGGMPPMGRDRWRSLK